MNGCNDVLQLQLQPLDRSVYGPLKKFYSSSCDSWMKVHPGKTMTIYDIPGVVNDAWPRASTPMNIRNGFQVSGIFPFNRHIFTDDDFLPAYATDRPFKEIESLAESYKNKRPTEEVQRSPAADHEPIEVSNPSPEELTRTDQTMQLLIDTCVPGTSYDRSCLNSPAAQSDRSSTSRPMLNMTPEMIRPFPKANPRKTRVNCRTRKTKILTSSPIKKRLFLEKKQREQKNPKTSGRPITKRKIMAKSKPSNNDSNICLVCGDTFENSRPGETWVQCVECGDLPNAECTNNESNFRCHVCGL